jgi:LuxR family maltose regulon positive regulatory protein
MSSSILVTILFIPSSRPELDSRPRLIEQLNRGLHRKLTLIFAPAGYGKTTLVTERLQSKGDDASSPSCLGWLSLDEGDNDPVQFLARFTAALNRLQGMDVQLGEGVLPMLQPPQPPPAPVAITTLINEITSASEKRAFVESRRGSNNNSVSL